MKTAVKLFGILISLTIIFTTCLKIKEPQKACLVTGAIQGKRKVVFVYDNNRRLILITDYSDSTYQNSSNTVNFYYDIYGQVTYITENLESGASDSIAFGYSGSSKIIETQYLKTGDGYFLNYRRNYLFNSQGNLLNDTVYSIQKGGKGQIIYKYSTYEYDQNDNVKTLENYYPNGTLNYSVSFEYGDTLIQSGSYVIARFVVLGHYESNYQYVLPNRKNLLVKETLNLESGSSFNTYSYELDSKDNAVHENKVVSICEACNTTTTYNYYCN